jgi:hypothetical protein
MNYSILTDDTAHGPELFDEGLHQRAIEDGPIAPPRALFEEEEAKARHSETVEKCLDWVIAQGEAEEKALAGADGAISGDDVATEIAAEIENPVPPPPPDREAENKAEIIHRAALRAAECAKHATLSGESPEMQAILDGLFQEAVDEARTAAEVARAPDATPAQKKAFRDAHSAVSEKLKERQTQRRDAQIIHSVFQRETRMDMNTRSMMAARSAHHARAEAREKREAALFAQAQAEKTAARFSPLQHAYATVDFNGGSGPVPMSGAAMLNAIKNGGVVVSKEDAAAMVEDMENGREVRKMLFDKNYVATENGLLWRLVARTEIDILHRTRQAYEFQLDEFAHDIRTLENVLRDKGFDPWDPKIDRIWARPPGHPANFRYKFHGPWDIPKHWEDRRKRFVPVYLTDPKDPRLDQTRQDLRPFEPDGIDAPGAMIPYTENPPDYAAQYEDVLPFISIGPPELDAKLARKFQKQNIRAMNEGRVPPAKPYMIPKPYDLDGEMILPVKSTLEPGRNMHKEAPWIDPATIDYTKTGFNDNTHPDDKPGADD